jgi:hypothetical protein
MSILALTSDTLIGTAAAGNIEYNGQFFGTDSNASRAQLQRITQATAVASTSGTSIDFTGLPAWVKRITVMLNGMSTSGTADYQIQLGAGSITSTGYITRATYFQGTSLTGANVTTGFRIANYAAANSATGSIIFTLITGNTWVGNGYFADSGANATSTGGSIALSGTLDRVRITANGTDTFDAGSINILYEG